MARGLVENKIISKRSWLIVKKDNQGSNLAKSKLYHNICATMHKIYEKSFFFYILNICFYKIMLMNTYKLHLPNKNPVCALSKSIF